MAKEQPIPLMMEHNTQWMNMKIRALLQATVADKVLPKAMPKVFAKEEQEAIKETMNYLCRIKNKMWHLKACAPEEQVKALIGAMIDLARLYAAGRLNPGVPQYGEAIDVLQKAALLGEKIGDGRADEQMNGLAVELFHQAGEVAILDKRGAIRLYEYAWNLGEDKALSRLGHLYQTLSDSCSNSSESEIFHIKSKGYYKLSMKYEDEVLEKGSENIKPVDKNIPISPEQKQSFFAIKPATVPVEPTQLLPIEMSF